MRHDSTLQELLDVHARAIRITSRDQLPPDRDQAFYYYLDDCLPPSMMNPDLVLANTNRQVFEALFASPIYCDSAPCVAISVMRLRRMGVLIATHWFIGHRGQSYGIYEMQGCYREGEDPNAPRSLASYGQTAGGMMGGKVLQNA